MADLGIVFLLKEKRGFLIVLFFNRKCLSIHESIRKKTGEVLSARDD